MWVDYLTGWQFFGTLVAFGVVCTILDWIQRERLK